jgi:hypothetical protein
MLPREIPHLDGRPGLTRSEPAAVAAFGGAGVDLYVRGLDNEIWESVFYNVEWSGIWEQVPGGGLSLSGPAVVEHRGAHKLFVRGLDNRIYENDFDDKGWTLVPAGAFFFTISAPAAVSYRGSLYLFVRGLDNRVYFSVDGTTWRVVPDPGPFTFLNPNHGLTLAAPSALVDGTTLKLFITGVDHGIWENDFDGTRWSGWSEISDHPLTTSAPAAVKPPFGNLSPEIFLTTEDGKILECFF